MSYSAKRDAFFKDKPFGPESPLAAYEVREFLIGSEGGSPFNTYKAAKGEMGDLTRELEFAQLRIWYRVTDVVKGIELFYRAPSGAPVSYGVAGNNSGPGWFDFYPRDGFQRTLEDADRYLGVHRFQIVGIRGWHDRYIRWVEFLIDRSGRREWWAPWQFEVYSWPEPHGPNARGWQMFELTVTNRFATVHGLCGCSSDVVHALGLVSGWWTSI